MAHYRLDPAFPSDVARQLTADSLVTGSVRLGDDRLRVTVQLVKRLDATVAWQATRERTLDDRLTLQVEIASEIAQLETTLAIAPGSPAATAELARAWRDLGEVDRAAEILATVEPDWSRLLGRLAAGDRDAARDLLSGWLDPAVTYQAPYWRAERCMWAGGHDHALVCLERAYEEHQVQLMFVAIEPAFAPLGGDARFTALVTRVCGCPVPVTHRHHHA